MIIIGIDPGLQKTGWGVIEQNGSTLRFIDCGLIKTNATDALPQRLSHLHVELCEIVEGVRSGLEGTSGLTAAVEKTFVNRNPADALKLGQARGVVLAVPGLYGIEAAEYSANKIKKSIVGNGHATKDQMMMMVKMLLPACGQIGPDEADALAVAITHAHYGSMKTALAVKEHV